MTVHSPHSGNSCHVFWHNNKARFHLELVWGLCSCDSDIYTWLILFWYIIHQEDEVSPSPSALSRSARPSSERGRNTSPISSYHSRESSRHCHSWKTTRSSVENKRSTSPLSAYDSRERQQSEVSRRSRSRSRSPCASSGGTCQTAGKDLFLKLNHNC